MRENFTHNLRLLAATALFGVKKGAWRAVFWIFRRFKGWHVACLTSYSILFDIMGVSIKMHGCHRKKTK
jgi:hypothetical protein